MIEGSQPLSLAYLAEISFVINLAYHELDSYKLRYQIGHTINLRVAPFVAKSFKGKGSFFALDLYNAYDSLMQFSKGRGDGWKGDRRSKELRRTHNEVVRVERRKLEKRRVRTLNGWGGCRQTVCCWMLQGFYKWVLRRGIDRRIAELSMLGVVLILLFLTLAQEKGWYANHLIGIWPHLWLSLYLALAFTVVIPPFFMVLGRECRKFCLGWLREHRSSEPDISSPDYLHQRGRLYMLVRDFESKATLALETKMEELPSRSV